MGEMNTASGPFPKLTWSNNRPSFLYALTVHKSLRVRTLSVLTVVSSSSGIMRTLESVLVLLKGYIRTFIEIVLLRNHRILQKCVERDISNEEIKLDCFAFLRNSVAALIGAAPLLRKLVLRDIGLRSKIISWTTSTPLMKTRTDPNPEVYGKGAHKQIH